MKLKKTTAIDLIATLFIFLFTYTAISKLSALAHFQSVLGQSPLLHGINRQVAWSVPVIEMVTVVLLFFQVTRLLGLYFSLGLMICFTIYIGYMLLNASHLPCTCGGVLKELTWSQHLWFNLFFLTLAGIAIKLLRNSKNDLKILLQ